MTDRKGVLSPYMGIEAWTEPDGWRVRLERHSRWWWHVSVLEPESERIGLDWPPGMAAHTRRGAMRLANRSLKAGRQFRAMECLRAEVRA